VSEPAARTITATKPAVGRLAAILACPRCHGPVTEQQGGLACHGCDLIFPYSSHGAPLMVVDPRSLRHDKEPPASPGRRFLRSLVPSGEYPGINMGLGIDGALAWMLDQRPGALVVNVGSGETHLHPALINLDIYSNPFVDVVSDGARLPFLDQSVDGILCESIMEHVRKPWEVAAEFMRVLKPGGFVYVVAPFIFPYHDSPIDCWRYTTTGLEILFEGTRKIQSGYLKGPASAYARITAAFPAVVLSFGNPFLYRATHSVFRIALHPLSYLDYFVKKSPWAHLVASGTYYLGERVPTPAAEVARLNSTSS
jgi:SAM-dependent methyltransferase